MKNGISSAFWKDWFYEIRDLQGNNDVVIYSEYYKLLRLMIENHLEILYNGGTINGFKVFIFNYLIIRGYFLEY